MTEQPLDGSDSTERFLGLGEDVHFDDVIAERLASEDRRLGNIAANQELLDANGVGIDAKIAPSGYKLGLLQASDWENVRKSERPLLTLYAASNFRHEEAETTFVPVGKQFPRHADPRLGNNGLHNMATMASLPLVHGMSANAFIQLAENQGTMQSNKTRFKQSGSDALTFHGAGVGATNLADRELGLDQYVFFDYGRPAVNHRKQPEITLVVDPSAAEQAGAFMTKQDVADTENIDTYMDGLTTPEYFHETALLRIHNSVTEQGETRSGGYHTGYSIYNNTETWRRGQDGDFGFDSYPRFSTYEVKVPDPPGVGMDTVRRVIVRDEETFKHLQETMGDRYEFVHEPRLRAAGERIPDYQGDARDAAAIDQGNYPDLLAIPGLYEQKLGELIDNDYAERSAYLDALPDDEKELVVAVIGTSDAADIGSEDITKRVDEKSNIYLVNGTVAIYSDMDAVRDDVANTYDLKDFSTAAGQAAWFHNPYGFSSKKQISTPSGTCIIATIERSKQDPSITRIVGTEPFSLDQVA